MSITTSRVVSPWQLPPADPLMLIVKHVGKDFNTIRVLTHVCKSWSHVILTSLCQTEKNCLRQILTLHLKKKGESEESIQLKLNNIALYPCKTDNFQSFRQTFINLGDLHLCGVSRFSFLQSDAYSFARESLFFNDFANSESFRIPHARLSSHFEFERILKESEGISNLLERLERIRQVFSAMVESNFGWLGLQLINNHDRQVALLKALTNKNPPKTIEDLNKLEVYVLKIKDSKKGAYEILTTFALKIDLIASIRYLKLCGGKKSEFAFIVHKQLIRLNRFEDSFSVIDEIDNGLAKWRYLKNLCMNSDLPESFKFRVVDKIEDEQIQQEVYSFLLPNCQLI